MKVLIFFTLILITLSPFAHASKELSADQNKRGTTTERFKNIDLDDANITTYRILRETKWVGKERKYYNLINGVTTFVISTGYYDQTPMFPATHDCIFIVKGNLTLDQIKNGNINHKDIINVDCTTYRREKKQYGTKK